MIIKNEKVIVFFGDARSCPVDCKSEAFHGYCQKFASNFGLDKILFDFQVHGVGGYILDSQASVNVFKSRQQDGDFLITNQKKIGVGVVTADCLPVLVYDKKNEVIAAIHAGWRSAVSGICKITFEAMHKRFGTHVADLDVYFGPGAKSCCYEVQPDFLSNLKQFSFKDEVIHQCDGRLFYDNVLLNKLLLTEIGLDPQKINCDYNLCTICNRNFNSYRRDSKTPDRQISFIAMNKLSFPAVV